MPKPGSKLNGRLKNAARAVTSALNKESREAADGDRSVKVKVRISNNRSDTCTLRSIKSTYCTTRTAVPQSPLAALHAHTALVSWL